MGRGGRPPRRRRRRLRILPPPLDRSPRRDPRARRDPLLRRGPRSRHAPKHRGRGPVQPLDGFTATRKASHPELLEELADDFAASKFDVRRLMKSILLSKPYQLSSKSTAPDRIFA